MGVVNTTYTFTGTDTITSSKLNNIIDDTTFTSDAISGSTLQIVSPGKLAVAAGGITSNELGSNSVTTAKITDANVTTAKIADASVTPAKLSNSDFGAFTVASGVATLDDNSVTTSKITDANITAPKLSGTQTGTAPIFGIRAWVNFNAQANTDLSGTYARTSSTTVTITATAHGLIAGNAVFIDFAVGTGTAPFDGLYLVDSVTDANTFTVISSTTTTSTGTATLRRKTIRGSGNVSCVSAAYSGANPASPPASDQSAGNGYYVLNFSTAMPDSNFCVSGVVSQDGELTSSSGNDVLGGSAYNEKCAFITSISVASSAVACLYNNVQIIR
jgi:hypothetical protein